MKRLVPISVILAMIISLLPLTAVSVVADSWTYTTDTDFNEGSLNNVVVAGTGEPAQLQLSDETEPFNFIWVAVSSRGTVVKIDTETGQVLGEYWTSPSGSASNPSRTTVDMNGDVWVANRNLNPGSVIHIASIPTDQNGDGIITTSTGLGDVLAWGTDEAVLHYVTVNSWGTRHVSVNADNNVWVSGTGNRVWDLIDGSTGAIIRSEPSVGYGGYGGLIDGNGVIWSANNLLWWDTAKPITDPSTKKYGHDSYGLGIDSMGNVWNTALSGPDNPGTNNDGTIRKFAPDGTLLGTYNHGDPNAQGCVADQNDHIWVAHCLWHSDTVGHILNDGTYIGNVFLEANSGATGVAVDANGYIWATGYNTGRVYRIDPNAGPIGADGVTRVGEVDMVVDVGGNLYNYSDMTGSTLYGAPESGSWKVVKDSNLVDARWGVISWAADEPGDSSITVTVASSTDGITFGPPEVVSNGDDLAVADGQYLRIIVDFSRSTTTDADDNGINDSPILYDLSIEAFPQNEPPVADAGEDQTVEQAYYQGADVTLDGSGSTDDGQVLPLTYVWTWDAGSANGVSPVVSLPLGTTKIKLTVNDGEFEDSDIVEITVVDTTPPDVDAGEDVTVEQTSLDGAPADLPDPIVKDICDADPDVVIKGLMDIYPLGDTEITVTATDASGNTASDTVVVHVVDTTAPDLSCVESVNPHGNNVPGEDRNSNGKDKNNKNPDGFYEITVSDICDATPDLWVGTADDPYLFNLSEFVEDGKIVVKFTEDADAVPECKKMGSSNGEAGAVIWHIILPTDPVVSAVDDSGNVQTCTGCLVPPPPM